MQSDFNLKLAGNFALHGPNLVCWLLCAFRRATWSGSTWCFNWVQFCV